MKLYIVAVFDSAMNAYARPVFVPAVGAALRGFSDEVNRVAQAGQANDLNSHPEDFSLYNLGQFDEETGGFEPPPTEGGRPLLIARAKDLKAQ